MSATNRVLANDRVFSVGQSVAAEPLADDEALPEDTAGPGEVAPVLLESPPPQPVSTRASTRPRTTTRRFLMGASGGRGGRSAPLPPYPSSWFCPLRAPCPGRPPFPSSPVRIRLP